jgi:hypothetical protein
VCSSDLRLSKRIKRAHHFRAVLLKLLKESAGNAVRNPEPALISFDDVQ